MQQYFSAGIFHPVYIVGTHLVSAVGKGGVADGHLQRAQFGGAQRQRQVVGQLRFIEAEASHVVPDVLAADCTGEAHRDQISGKRQCLAQTDGTREPVFILLGPPGLIHAGFVHDDGRVRNDACRGKALVEGRRVHEGFETRTRLPAGLCHTIVLALKVVEAADQGDHGAILGIHGDQSALCLRYLHEQQGLGRPPHRIDHVTRGQNLGCLGRPPIHLFVGQFAPCPGQLVPRQRDLPEFPDVDSGAFLVDLLHDGGLEAADHREFLELGVEVLGGRELGEIDFGGRTAIAMTAIVFQQPRPQRHRGRGL